MHDPSMLAGGDYWFRCSEPERPGDEMAVYVWLCDACFIGLATDVPRDPDSLSIEYTTGPAGGCRSTLARTLEKVLAYREGEGRPTFGVLAPQVTTGR